MRRLLAAVGTTMFLCAVGPLAIVHAQEANPTDAVPDSASVVARLKAPQASVAKLAEFVDAVQPGFGFVVTANLQGLGQVIRVPGLNGVDLEKEIWMIVFTESQTAPKVVFVLTAKDVQAVTDALPDDYESHTVGKMVVYSDDEDAVAEVRKTMERDGKPLWPKIDEASKKLFDASDVAVLVNVKQLIEDFSDEFEQAEPKLEGIIENLIDAMPDDQQPQFEAIFGIYRDIGKSLLHGIRDSNSWTGGLSFTKSAIRYEDRLQVASDTERSKFLAKQPPADFSLLNKFPANKSIYVGLKFDMASMMEWSLKSTKALFLNATDEQLAQYDAAVNEMKELKYDDINFYFDLDGSVPAMRVGAVTAVTPGKRAREIGEKMAKSMSEMKTAQFTQTTTYESNVDKIGGGEVDRITVKQTFDDSADPLGIQKKVQSIIIGEGGMQTLFLYQANRSVQTMGNGIEELKSLVAALESTKSNNAAMTATRQQLAAKANLVALFDVAKMLSSGLKLAASAKVIPMNTTALDKLRLESSYIGYSLAIEPSAIRSQVEVPATQIQNLVKFIPVFQPQR